MTLLLLLASAAPPPPELVPVANGPGIVERVYRWEISDPTGAILLGVWDDAPTPAFSFSLGGQEAMQLILPRDYGMLDEPSDLGGLGTMAWGNRVTVRVTTGDTLATPGRLGLLGGFILGTDALGGLSGLDRVLWRGTIETWRPARATGQTTVTLLPLGAALETAYVPASGSLTGDTCALGQALVQTYCPVLTWDARNPAASGVVATIDLRGESVRQWLETLRDRSGAGWVLTVTARGTVRLFQPDLSVPTHSLSTAGAGTLAEGVTAVNAQLEKSGIGRRKAVRVTCKAGSFDEFADDYDPAYPRMEVVSAGDITDESVARALAKARLASLDAMTLRGEVDVLSSYPFETIEPGDTVALTVERPVSTDAVSVLGRGKLGSFFLGSVAGYLDYTGQNVIVAQVDYTDDGAHLQLSQAQPDLLRALARKLADLDATRRQVADAGATRDATTDAVTFVRPIQIVVGNTGFLKTAVDPATGAPKIGFNGADPVDKPQISGTSADAVVENLLNALENAGLIERV